MASVAESTGPELELIGGAKYAAQETSPSTSLSTGRMDSVEYFSASTPGGSMMKVGSESPISDLHPCKLAVLFDATDRRLDVVARFNAFAIRRTQDDSKGRPILIGIKLFTSNASHLLDGGAHTRITYNPGLFPVRDHLLLGSDGGGQFDLGTSLLNGFIDSRDSSGRWFLHGSRMVYLQAYL